MAVFKYRGRDRGGRLVNGELNAENPSGAATQLIQSGVTPVRIEPVSPASAGLPVMRLKLFTPKPGLSELMLFARQMHALTKAGIPIVRALKGLADSSRNPPMAAALLDVIDSLNAGRDLAGSLAKHADIFPPLFVNVVRVGENSGKLDEAFQRLYQYVAFDKFTRDQIASALRYPVIVLVAVAAAIAVVMGMVVPKFSKIFAAFGSELPTPTRIIIGVSNFTVGYWWLVLMAIAAITLSLRAWLSTDAGRYAWDRAKMRLPILGGIILRATLARFARAFTMTSRAGVPLLDALTLVSHAVQNEYVGQHVRSMREYIERGDALSRAAAATGLFTPLVLQMLAVGEETGRVDDMMDEVADFYDRDVANDVENLGTLMEPMLIIIVGGVVLVLALGVFLPMWDLAGVAMKH
ncbi:MAG TPA: type II secretion system F family protein [Verrucomicrobiae bacterium]|nr:type II secretion system F family protein [Verrucomicrobiae bacterium]